MFVWLAPFDLAETSETADVAFKGESPNDMAGYSISAADLDGDGRAEIVIGAPGDDTNGEDAGKVYVVPGGAGL